MHPPPPRGTWQREPSTLVVERTNSADTVEPPFAIVSDSIATATALEFATHSHPLHELVWVRGGTMTVRFSDRVLTVPQGQALWIPAGCPHAGRTTAGAILYDALFDPRRSLTQFETVTSVDIDGPLSALLQYLSSPTITSAARMRAEAVVFDVLLPSSRSHELPLPSDARIAATVASLIADPADRRTAAAWADVAGVSERTLNRLFRMQTGLSFARWRLVLRVHRAIALLTEGLEVRDVAPAVGYAQPSNFIEAFTRVLGVTPGSFAATMHAP